MTQPCVMKRTCSGEREHRSRTNVSIDDRHIIPRSLDDEEEEDENKDDADVRQDDNHAFSSCDGDDDGDDAAAATGNC